MEDVAAVLVIDFENLVHVFEVIKLSINLLLSLVQLVRIIQSVDL